MENKREYYKLKWYQKIWFKIVDGLNEKRKNFHFSFVKLAIFLVIVVIIFALAMIIIKGASKFPVKAEYDKTGFVDSSALTEEELTIANSKYEFKLDTTNTHFTLLNKETNTSWSSRPEENEKADTLTVYYNDDNGVPSAYGNYKYSINYEGQKRFLVRKDENSIEVLYLLGGKIKIDFTDLPELISEERFTYFTNKAKEKLETLDKQGDDYKFLKKAIRIIEYTYLINEVHHYYKLENPSSLSENYINTIYRALYEFAGYTKEDLDKDNKEFGLSGVKDYPTFEVSIKYTLAEDGLDIDLVNDAIKDYEVFPLVYIDVLPYFGCVDSTKSGYALIPDGSGILLDFNSPRSYANYYERRIYNDDFAQIRETAAPKTEDIKLGLYGVSVNDGVKNNGFINIITNSAESCSIISKINTKTASIDGLNQTYYRYYYRETDIYDFTSLAGVEKIQTWTNMYNSSTLSLKVKDLEGGSDYVDMAKEYQAYLVENGLLKKNSEESLLLNLTLLGGYLRDAYFLGIPYKKVASLTNDKQVYEIAEMLKSAGIDDLNIIYQGFWNDGINTTSLKDIDYNGVIASKKDLKKLVKNLCNIDVNIYPSVNITSAYTKKDISNNDIIRNMYGKISTQYASSEPTYLVDKKTTPYYYLLPSTFDKTTKNLLKQTNKIGINDFALSDLGNLVYGSYKTKNTIFKSDMVEKYDELMNKYFNSRKILTKEPCDFALKYTSIAYDVPFSGSNYQVVKTSVPFYQLVLSGYLDYSSTAINLNDEYNFDYYKMKLIETCSQISMTWSYENTIDLIDTEYNYYYSTYYKNWFEKTINLYNELKQLSVFNSNLKSHELLESTGKVTKSYYANGVEIVFNYQNVDYIYNGINVPANSYRIVKAGD